jgi:DNA invertase Pin-like site-specific DNA recombinase
MEKKKFISWRRVSTWRQGETGLGLDAQLRTVKAFVEFENGELLADYEEVYTGTELNECVQLQKAIEHCKRTGATLMIAKSNRFRNCAEALSIWEKMEGHIYFCDAPSSDKFTITILFAIAEREALSISLQTKAGLESIKEHIKANGHHVSRKGRTITHLGRDKGADLSTANAASAASRRETAKNNASNQRFYRYICRYESKNGRVDRNSDIIEIIDDLNALGYKTSTGMSFDKPRFYSMLKKIRAIY